MGIESAVLYVPETLTLQLSWESSNHAMDEDWDEVGMLGDSVLLQILFG